MSQAQVNSIVRGYSHGLDTMRIMAAMLVVGMHLRAALFVDWPESLSTGFPSLLFYFLTSLGSEAVVAFFVLSGFLVGGSVLAKSEAFAWKPYLLSRLCRLWIVLVPALLLVAVLVPFTPFEFLSGAYRAAWSSGPVAGEGSCSPAVWLGNLFFLQKIFIPVFCTDGPLWSLAYEFWYYILFPLIWIGYRRRQPVCILMAGIMAPFLGWPVLKGFVFWLVGALASVLSEGVAVRRGPLVRLARFVFLCIGLFMVLLSIALGKGLFGTPGNSFLESLALALSFALLVVVCSPRLTPPSGLRREFLGGLTRRLSESSFSLYVLHFPLICLFVPRLSPAQHASLSPVAMTQFVGLFVACCLASIGFASLTEWRTPELRRFLMGRLSPA